MSVPETKIQPVQQMSVGWTRDQVELVKRTVAKDATDDELKMFLYLARQYNLDPFKREIVFTKFQNRPSFITTRDGYLKIAMSDPNFDGLQAFVVHEGDEFEIIAEEFKVHHKFGLKRGKIIGAWGAAYHKQRKPVICFVEFEEYNKPTWNTWKEYPSAMIQKVAEAFVLKRQFNISGLVTREEIGMETYESTPEVEEAPVVEVVGNGNGNGSKPPAPTSSQEPPASEERHPTDKQLKRLLAISHKAGVSYDEMKTIIKQTYGKDHSKDLTITEYDELCNTLEVKGTPKKDAPSHRGQREERGVWPSADSEAAMTIEQAVYADDNLND